MKADGSGRRLLGRARVLAEVGYTAVRCS